MSLDRNAYRALAAGIHAFHRELHSADMKTSLVVNLDPRDFQRVLRDIDPMFGSATGKDGSLLVMGVVVRPRALKD